jgi:hypothetical protein
MTRLALDRFALFLCENLPSLIEPAWSRFQDFQDLVHPYATGALVYAEFAGRVRRRTRGQDEDSDWVE